MTKLLLIGSSSPPDRGSGINTYVNEIVSVYLQQGHRVVYVAPPLEKKAKLDDAEHLVVGQNDCPAVAVKKILQFISDNAVDLIINNDNAFLQSAAPWVNTVFVSVGHMSRSSVATLACYNHQWLDYIVTISSAMQRTFVERFTLDTAKVPIIYNGVVDPFNGQLPPKNTNPAALNIVYAGGDNPNKGAKLIVKMLADPRWQQCQHQLHLFGPVGKKMQAKLQGVERVTCYGRVERAYFINQLKNADVFLLPSYAEGCPMAMLEAMSYGLIPIASDGIGAMSRIVIHGQEGFIARLKNWSDDFYACLNRLSQNIASVNMMKVASYQRFCNDFQSKKTAENLLALADAPLINRESQPSQITILKWHRPLLSNTNKAPVIDRLAIKRGYLRISSQLSK